MAFVPGILSDSAIARAVREGDIEIDPWSPDQLNPTSYDLTLGSQVTVYKEWVCFNEQWEKQYAKPRDGSDLYPVGGVYDVKRKPDTTSFEMDAERGWVIKPGIGYLLHTRERVHTKKFVPIVDGKSSLGRLFVLVHFTAGFGDPNFDGQYTLEVSALHPVRLYPGMNICQIRFHSIEGEVEKPYAGNYVGETARGAVPSRAWNQFKR